MEIFKISIHRVTGKELQKKRNHSSSIENQMAARSTLLVLLIWKSNKVHHEMLCNKNRFKDAQIMVGDTTKR